jgi:hypothetical protein
MYNARIGDWVRHKRTDQQGLIIAAEPTSLEQIEFSHRAVGDCGGSEAEHTHVTIAWDSDPTEVGWRGCWNDASLEVLITGSRYAEFVAACRRIAVARAYLAMVDAQAAAFNAERAYVTALGVLNV